MNITHTLEELRAYLIMTRGVGHTHLMKVGTNNFRTDKAVLCLDKSTGMNMGLRNSEVISLNNMTSLRGHPTPLVVDHSALIEIMNKTLVRLSELESEIVKLRVENNDLMHKVDKNLYYGNTYKSTP